MGRKTYNKLVRDRIPEIIEASGAECKTEILSDEKYLEMIDAKLDYENGCSATLLAGKEMGVVYCLQGNGIDRADTAGCNGKGVKENESYTLNTIDRHAVCYGEAQPHQEVMRLREGKEGGGKGALIQTDMSGTIACNNDQTLFQQTETCYIVRRLTPLECCRLQGFPDDWAKDIPHSDAQEHRMWGNGMALPNALYIMEGIADALAKEGMG